MQQQVFFDWFLALPLVIDIFTLNNWTLKAPFTTAAEQLDSWGSTRKAPITTAPDDILIFFLRK